MVFAAITFVENEGGRAMLGDYLNPMNELMRLHDVREEYHLRLAYIERQMKRYPSLLNALFIKNDEDAIRASLSYMGKVERRLVERLMELIHEIVTEDAHVSERCRALIALIDEELAANNRLFTYMDLQDKIWNTLWQVRNLLSGSGSTVLLTGIFDMLLFMDSMTQRRIKPLFAHLVTPELLWQIHGVGAAIAVTCLIGAGIAWLTRDALIARILRKMQFLLHQDANLSDTFDNIIGEQPPGYLSNALNRVIRKYPDLADLLP